MSVTTKVYGKGITHVDVGGIVWGTDTIKLALVTSAYTPDQGNDEFWSDVVAHEIAAGGGYTTGGYTLTGDAKAYDATTREDRFDANDLNGGALTPASPFRYGIIYKDTGVAATSPLLAYINFGADQDPGGLPFAIQWPATGIFYGQAS